MAEYLTPVLQNAGTLTAPNVRGELMTGAQIPVLDVKSIYDTISYVDAHPIRMVFLLHKVSSLYVDSSPYSNFSLVFSLTNWWSWKRHTPPKEAHWDTI